MSLPLDPLPAPTPDLGQHVAVQHGDIMMLFLTWYNAALLAYESGNVVQLRLWRLSAGGRSAVDESFLMVCEKMDAAHEAGSSLAAGHSILSVVEGYRGHVAANAQRLREQPRY